MTLKGTVLFVLEIGSTPFKLKVTVMLEECLYLNCSSSPKQLLNTTATPCSTGKAKTLGLLIRLYPTWYGIIMETTKTTGKTT